MYQAEGRSGPARKLLYRAKGITAADAAVHFKEAQILAYTPVTQLEHESVANREKGVKELERYVGTADPGMIVLNESLATTYEQQKKFEEAEATRKKLLSIREGLQGKKSVLVADAHAALANLYENWGREDISKKKFQSAVSVLDKAKTSYETAIALYQMLGLSTYKLENMNQSMERCRKLEKEAAVKL